MKPLTERSNSFQIWLHSPWIIALFLTAVFFLVNGYIYGWDDQHLEIPLLKSLINPDLFAGDYYVESLKKNFPSFFYPILAKLISVEQIPAVYLTLFIISRYFFLFWTYKLWHHIAQDRFKAICCVLTFLYVLRVEEFLYRTFSHQEFTLAFVAAGLYYFFKERFVIAALILGIGANFHAVYCLFPMLYICFYLLWQVRKHGFSTLLKTGLTFTICAAPFIATIIFNRLSPEQSLNGSSPDNWLPLFVRACPQNFFFPDAPLVSLKRLWDRPETFFQYSRLYIYTLALFLVNLGLNESFRRNKKALSYCFVAILLVAVSFVFTQVYPNRFILDLNLIRNRF